MNKKNPFMYYFRELGVEAEKMGYYISSVRPKNGSNVSHTYRRIEVRGGCNRESLYEFCHELGHCVIYGKVKPKIINEFVAWLIGVKFMRKAKIPVKIDYFIHAFKCWKTYITKPSSL